MRQLRDCLFPSDQASKGVTGSMIHDTVQSTQLGQSMGRSVPGTPLSTGVPSLGNLTNVQQILSGIQASKGGTASMVHDTVQSPQLGQSVIARRTSKVVEILSNPCSSMRSREPIEDVMKSNIIKMFYNGEGIPVVEKEEAKIIQRTVQTIQTGMANQQCNIPEIRTYSGSSFTEITFSLDLGKFKMDALD
ncbi:hypothetical protein DAPPUDRAFT_317435 [Daphnia pulex]|uniref:Uncharacterized protein n=1 Tax=Daphnia pulex TaxID=6669 RepID=E9GFZ6_DAPPU|nr:hypothetical protein DAPPUDRAFT_317435 [Daphnia pulex]|eukprot:EFX81584.1 hypothetical protein DAPPUDRAFT_317435 [Daphnia pulex]